MNQFIVIHIILAIHLAFFAIHFRKNYLPFPTSLVERSRLYKGPTLVEQPCNGLVKHTRVNPCYKACYKESPFAVRGPTHREPTP